MKNIIVITFLLFLMVSCTKKPELRKLNIYMKSTEQVFESSIEFGIEILGNPFIHFTTIHIVGASNAEILISNEEGQKKFHLENESTVIDFSEEKAGVYYLEALIDNVVFRKYLIKQDPK